VKSPKMLMIVYRQMNHKILETNWGWFTGKTCSRE